MKDDRIAGTRFSCMHSGECREGDPRRQISNAFLATLSVHLNRLREWPETSKSNLGSLSRVPRSLITIKILFFIIYFGLNGPQTKPGRVELRRVEDYITKLIKKPFVQ